MEHFIASSFYWLNRKEGGLREGGTQIELRVLYIREYSTDTRVYMAEEEKSERERAR